MNVEHCVNRRPCMLTEVNCCGLGDCTSCFPDLW